MQLQQAELKQQQFEQEQAMQQSALVKLQSYQKAAVLLPLYKELQQQRSAVTETQEQQQLQSRQLHELKNQQLLQLQLPRDGVPVFNCCHVEETVHRGRDVAETAQRLQHAVRNLDATLQKARCIEPGKADSGNADDERQNENQHLRLNIEARQYAVDEHGLVSSDIGDRENCGHRGPCLNRMENGQGRLI